MVSAHFIQPADDLSKIVDGPTSFHIDDDDQVLNGDDLRIRAKVMSGYASSSSERFANFMREAQLNENQNSLVRSSSMKHAHKPSNNFRQSSSVKIHNSDTDKDDDELQLFEKLEQRLGAQSKRASKQLQSLQSLGSLRHN
mmetsp:Transcript_1295/g.1604  ORF Transcript_1295/g.1604 Transcript_1295/m.1604 type:complete len:141 (+) Transcript_1295:2058-2480(+)